MNTASVRFINGSVVINATFKNGELNVPEVMELGKFVHQITAHIRSIFVQGGEGFVMPLPELVGSVAKHFSVDETLACCIIRSMAEPTGELMIRRGPGGGVSLRIDEAVVQEREWQKAFGALDANDLNRAIATLQKMQLAKGPKAAVSAPTGKKAKAA